MCWRSTQAICRYRKGKGINGPLFLGIDTHELSGPACASALEVLSANGVHVMLATNDEFTPTPAISHAILAYNRARSTGQEAQAIVDAAISHSPTSHHGGPDA